MLPSRPVSVDTERWRGTDEGRDTACHSKSRQTVLIVESASGMLQNATAEAIALVVLCLHFSKMLVGFFWVCFHPKVSDSAVFCSKTN